MLKRWYEDWCSDLWTGWAGREEMCSKVKLVELENMLDKSTAWKPLLSVDQRLWLRHHRDCFILLLIIQPLSHTCTNSDVADLFCNQPHGTAGLHREVNSPAGRVKQHLTHSDAITSAFPTCWRFPEEFTAEVLNHRRLTLSPLHQLVFITRVLWVWSQISQEILSS